MERTLYDVAPLPGCHPEHGLILASLQDSTREWRAELNTVSEDGIVWQPFPGGHSIGGVLLHMAGVEAYWIEQFCLGRTLSKKELEESMSDETDQDAVKWPVPPHKPLSYYYGIQDRIRARTLESVKHLPEPTHVKERGNEAFTMRWVLAHVADHEGYHGGQAVLLKELYLRRAK
jgi:uncharacterized damage-inducible protein DinB